MKDNLTIHHFDSCFDDVRKKAELMNTFGKYFKESKNCKVSKRNADPEIQSGFG